MRGEWVGKRRLGRTGETAAGTVGGGLLACAVLASVGGCGSADTGVLVELKNVPARSDRIALKTTLEGKPPTSVDVQELTASGLSRFGLSVPSSSSGRLVVDLQALDGDRCNQGSASVAVTLPTNRGAMLPATFTAQSPRKCDPLLPCADGTLCTQTPLQTTKLWSAWAISPSDIWAVGDASTILHWNGQIWQQQTNALPLTVDLSSVWASGPKDVWAVGGPTGGGAGYVFRYDGTSWTQSAIGATHYLNTIYGISKNDIWVVGVGIAAGTIPGEFWHWDGAIWAPVNTGTGTNGDNFSVWASAPNDVFVVGSNGAMQRYNGTSWSKISTGGTNSLYGVSGYVPAGGGPSVVYAAGTAGLVIHYDGSTAKRITATSTGTTLNAVWASAAAVYAAGAGGVLIKSVALTDSFSSLSTTTTSGLNGMTLSSNGIVWVVGTGGFQGYFDTRP